MGARVYAFYALLLFAIIGLSFAYSATVEEKTFAQMVYDDFVVSGANREKCEEIAFVRANDENYTILSVHADFMPNATGRIAGISVYVNDANSALTTLLAGNFLEDWARVILPKWELKEKNKIKLCAKTSDVVTEIKILNDSKIGTYRIADFSKEGAFTKTASNASPEVGEEVKVTVTLHNYGNEETFVTIKHIAENVEMPEIEITRGETEKNGWVAPGNEIAMEYYMRPKVAIRMSLPYAIAEYTNTFGETVKLASAMPDLDVKAIEQRLFAIVLPESNVKKTGERAKIAIAVKNQSTETIKDVFVSISLPEGIELEGSSSSNIPLIEAGETVSLAFYVSAQEPGTYRVGCNVTYDSVPLACDRVAIAYEAQGINYAIVAGAVLLAIGLAIYMYLYFSSEKK
ncbi:MAG: hypothetical protein HYW05_04430 [Candidatus Diapherotrites archaeon]|nr:hypothetical protein [Candidatus Diapherotrites archaeon]